MTAWRVVVPLCAALAIGMCVRDRLRRDEPVPVSPARALGVYPRHRPESLHEQALQAFERDARRREERFLEAAQPGRSFAATRVGQREIDAGRRSAAELFEIGAQLFHHRFRREEGFGDRDTLGLRRVTRGARGGPEAYACVDCHRRGGPAGAGDSSDNVYLDGDGETFGSALERNPIALHGAGVLELLAREMTADLQWQRDELEASARAMGVAKEAPLVSKGVRFGVLKAAADGGLDYRGVQGVDRDLVVKPFGWKGHAASLREMVEDELLQRHGMQSSWLVAEGTAERLGAFGAPDPDGDGVRDEIGEGQVTALTLFLAMQELPQADMPADAETVTLWSRGERRFAEIGCSRCHRPYLTLERTVYELPSRGGGPPVRVDLAVEGAEPRVARSAEGGSYRVYLFSDLKRHVVGPGLREPRPYRGVSGAEMLTAPLWGLSRSRPWLHDGRAPTLDAAILGHDGEATDARDAYGALRDEERAPLRVYVNSLTRARRLASP
jgi:hypothetical protein